MPMSGYLGFNPVVATVLHVSGRQFSVPVLIMDRIHQSFCQLGIIVMGPLLKHSA